VLAVIVGIRHECFWAVPRHRRKTDPTIDNALASMLASLALFGLGCRPVDRDRPRERGAAIGAGAAAEPHWRRAGLAVAGGTAVVGTARLADVAEHSLGQKRGLVPQREGNQYEAGKRRQLKFNQGHEELYGEHKERQDHVSHAMKSTTTESRFVKKLGNPVKSLI